MYDLIAGCTVLLLQCYLVKAQALKHWVCFQLSDSEMASRKASTAERTVSLVAVWFRGAALDLNRPWLITCVCTRCSCLGTISSHTASESLCYLLAGNRSGFLGVVTQRWQRDHACVWSALLAPVSSRFLFSVCHVLSLSHFSFPSLRVTVSRFSLPLGSHGSHLLKRCTCVCVERMFMCVFQGTCVMSLMMCASV